MGRDRVRYYVVKNGWAYWVPNARMKAAGFTFKTLGPDGDEAKGRALAENRKWDAYRKGIVIEEGPRYLSGSLGEAFEVLKQIPAVWQNGKSERTREEWERCWRRIGPVFGDVAPATVTLQQVADFRDAIRDTVSVSEAHRVIKIWRALWKLVATDRRYGITAGGDPSLGITNTAPPKRKAVWEYDEVRALAKHAWRMGLPQITAALSILWDTLLSPVDVRLLAGEQFRTRDGLIWFELDREKTGRDAYATLSRRSVRILQAYLDTLGPVVLPPDAPLLRDVTGKPLDKNRFGKLFRRVRDDLYPGDTRVMADIRRSGSVEAIRGGAAVEGLAAKLANTLSSSNFLFATYVPVDLEPIRAVDEARRTARRRNASATKSLTAPAEVRLFPKRSKEAGS